MLATGSGHRQTCACTILKCMHIIHHLDGRELLFMLPMSDQEIFHLVEEKVYRVIGSMLAEGFPITEFIGGRKNKDSLYTKLLSKREAVVGADLRQAALPHRHARARTTSSRSCSTCRRSSSRSTTSSRAEHQSIFHFRRYCQKRDALEAVCSTRCRRAPTTDYTPSDNVFSRRQLPGHPLRRRHAGAPPAQARWSARPRAAWALGPVVFVVCEFQVIDRETEAANELGEASHAKYKERQKKAVMRRLQLGVRPEQVPGRPKRR